MTPEKRQWEPNVTPMIDVMLVLIIVFMVLVVTGRKAMDMQLPQVCATGCAAGDAIVLEVLPAGAYRLNRQPVPRAELAQVLARVYAGRPDKMLSVAAQPDVRYGDVVEAMDVARGSGVQVVSFVPKPR